MAEYKSFHYLMHQVPENVKPVYVTGPAPLAFNELYSPREDKNPLLIHNNEKSYWRTRDRISYNLYEDLQHRVLIVTCYNVEKKESYRTIFLDLESLYFELEAKAQGNRNKLVRKKEQKLVGAELHKAAADFVVSRLNITADPLPWPELRSAAQEKEEYEKALASVSADNHGEPNAATESSAGSSEPPTSASVVAPMERMCTFNKMASDVFPYMEITKPENLNLDTIENVKLPIAPAEATQSETNANEEIAEVNPTADTSASISDHVETENGETVPPAPASNEAIQRKDIEKPKPVVAPEKNSKDKSNAGKKKAAAAGSGLSAAKGLKKEGKPANATAKKK